MSSEEKQDYRKGSVADSKQDDVQLAVSEELLSYTTEQEGKIRRKIDLYLLPVLAILYLMSYLDRSNMGNAAIIGLKEDLNLSSTQYNLCNSIFFIPYAIFEIPSNLVLKVLPPSKYIGLMVVAWGIVSTLQGIVQGFSGLMAARFFLAICEAGFFPAASYLLTMWYRRHEIQLRAGVFYSAGALSGALSGLLAYLINLMDGVGGLAGWRWLFILEGILTVLLGIAAPFLLPDSPDSARFLDAQERAIVKHRLKYDTGTERGAYSEEQAFKWKYVWSALRDYKVWLIVVVYWGSSIPIYGFIYALPTVVAELGYTSAIAQLMTIPIYVAAVIALLTAAYFSDKTKDRSLFVIGPLIVGGIGLIGLLAIPKNGYVPGALYFMLFLVAMGLYSIVCGTVAWTANNLAGPWKRSAGMALMISVGNLGGAAGTNIYLGREAPYYWTGYGTSLAVIGVSLSAAVFLRFKFAQLNKRKEMMTVEEVYARFTEEELLDLGDESPLFRYTI
ncbi:major facilitator superfamily domain-containing protein [Aspergillus karnatakaensis]|uniref:major facilitator superfamily domain-containing protein n=1 Tax=Aspergillus karnatakaensis TaxID=1810916 RepID=UPI003CCCA719